MKKVILLALLLTGCEPDAEQIANHMIRTPPSTTNVATEQPLPGLTCQSKLVMGMAEITCR